MAGTLSGPCLLLVLSLSIACPATAVTAAAPPAAAGQTRPESYRGWVAAAVEALERRGDPNSLATAAALEAIGGPNPAALELADRASTLAPEDAPIGWIRLRLCANVAGCDLRSAATAMRWVDPDNAAAWLPLLAAARKDKDVTEVDRVLADMAQAAHFDFYWNRLVVLMFESLKSVAKALPASRGNSDSARLLEVMNIASAEMIPPFNVLIDVCREPGMAAQRDTLGNTERRESCLKVAKTLQQGDTVIAEMAGMGLEKRLVPADSREFRALTERRHVLEWRTAQLAKFDAPLLPWVGNAHARLRLAHMRSLRREEDVTLAILRGEGAAIDPP
jgi:hypothetical protein